MNIRTYLDSDQSAVIDLILSIQQQEFGVSITAEDQPDLHDIEHFYQQGTGNFWVAVDAGAVIGTIALIDIGMQAVALRKMFVSPDYRGAKKGVAKALLNACHDWARVQGVRNIYLGTIDVYHAAMRFYEKNGYQAISQSQLPGSFPLIAVDNVFYQLELGPVNRS